MPWNKTILVVAIATIGFAGNYLISSRVSTAKANEAMNAGYTRWHDERRWCDPDRLDQLDWIAVYARYELDLRDDQNRLLDETIDAAKRSLQSAETLCALDRESIAALNLPQQIEAARAMLAESETILAEISEPLLAFHASLDDEQAQAFGKLINRDGRHGRRRE